MAEWSAIDRGDLKPPLLLHFDVNKTIVLSDSVQLKTVEDGIREGISELFWGCVKKNQDGEDTWDWNGRRPTCAAPAKGNNSSDRSMNYDMFCKMVVKDKKAKKIASRTWSLVTNPSTKLAMERFLKEAMSRMALSDDVKGTKEAKDAGLPGDLIVVLPALFHFVANLEKSKRTFSVLFRSFGSDHEKVMKEWNAFCEMRHPVYSHLLKDVGKLDGTVPGVPDRRISKFHTLYRDVNGPMLILDTLTNGPEGSPWDQWARTKPKEKEDTRNGRCWVKDVLQAEIIDGVENMQTWLREHLFAQRTSALKDDWAWWCWNDEQAPAGKLLLLLDGDHRTRQIFFDDNIEHCDARIVDCRGLDGLPAFTEAEDHGLLSKVNSVEAVMDDNYFMTKFLHAHREPKAEEAERESRIASAKLMEMLRKIVISDYEHLEEYMTNEGCMELFGQGCHHSIFQFYEELERGDSWLEFDEDGKILRAIETCFIKIRYRDLVLIETHEQTTRCDGFHGTIQTRNYLPGVRKSSKEPDYTNVLKTFFESGLQVNLTEVVTCESPDEFMPDAPEQTTGATLIYPLKCSVRQSQAAYVIPDHGIEVHREVLKSIGLPEGKHFTTEEIDADGSKTTRSWRWDNYANWMSKQDRSLLYCPTMNIQGTLDQCAKLFRGHPHRDVYENILLQMFEHFTATKLCGGFSGSLVIRVQPTESDGTLGDPCIVKMDQGAAIHDEYTNSVHVFEALPDRAAKILGDAVYAKNIDGEEFGGIQLELAGACWNVPELAQDSGNTLSTFKDLLIYESEYSLLPAMLPAGNSAGEASDRPFGNVYSVLVETFGSGGIAASLRKGGNGLRRHPDRSLLWSWYKLKGKLKSKYNPSLASTKAEEYPPAPAVKRLYEKYFGEEMPDLTEIVGDRIKPQLQELAGNAGIELRPIVCLVHGDLNAANIMIDALDAVWLIDFATSVELPLFTDMCKFEMAALFEYSLIPITPELLVEFASVKEDMWSKMHVGDWLRIDQDIAVLLLRELSALSHDALAAMSQPALDKLIEDVVGRSGRKPQKQKTMINALKARLVADASLMDAAFAYGRESSKALLQGDYLCDSLNIKDVACLEGPASRGASSMKYIMEISKTVRRYMSTDILNTFKDMGEPLQPIDAMSLQLWMAILCESYRIPGYLDIAPQMKIWCIYHCHLAAKQVLRQIEMLKSSWSNLTSLPMLDMLKNDIEVTCQNQSPSGAAKEEEEDKSFSEADSLWLFHNKHLFGEFTHVAKSITRKIHRACPMYKDEPGLYSIIFRILDKGDEQVMDFLSDSYDSKDDDWDLYLSGPGFVDDSMTAHLGSFSSKAPDSEEPYRIHLRSRIVQATPKFLSDYDEDIASAKEGKVNKISIAEWADTAMCKIQEQVADTSKRGSRFRRDTTNMAEKRGSKVASSFSVSTWLTVECIAKHRSSEDIMDMQLILGEPEVCYPPGTKFYMDASAMPNSEKASSETVVWNLCDTGSYVVGCALDSVNGAEDEFDPQPHNHVMMQPVAHKVGQRLLFRRDIRGWREGVVMEVPNENTCWRYRLEFIDNEADVSGGGKGEVLKHLNHYNSGAAVSQMSVSEFEDEFQKMKQYLRVRNSFHIDRLSGHRLEIKECALPTLTPLIGDSPRWPCDTHKSPGRSRFQSTTTMQPHLSVQHSEHMQNRAGARSSVSISSCRPSVQTVNNAAVDHYLASTASGWSMIMTALENFDQMESTCLPIAFLIVGDPGSGKACLMSRLVHDCVQQQRNYIVVHVPIADLAVRLSKDLKESDVANLDFTKTQTLFDEYLRRVYGEGLRYKMIGQARRMHRVMYLFQGLNEAGAFLPLIEQIILDLIEERQFVVCSTRPLTAGSDSLLLKKPELVTQMALEQFNDEQRHWIAHVRLGAGGAELYERFVKGLRDKDKVTDEPDTSQSTSVFGNPMMLSMLLCYLQSRQQGKDDKDAIPVSPRGNSPNSDGEVVTLTAVYRVAIDVMLARLQSKSQADRHDREKKIKMCKRILERIAMEMQLQQRSDIGVDEADAIVPQEYQETWKALKANVLAGHAMVLRVTNEEGGMQLRFFIKGFQSYFVASRILNDQDVDLPRLNKLLTDSWWSEMLEMLSDLSDRVFVRLIENRLKEFPNHEGNTFLHVAARVGQRPVIQLLNGFNDSNKSAIFARNTQSQTPLHVAASYGSTLLCKLLLEHNALINVQDARSCLPMHVAMQNSHFACAKFLLDQWNDANKDNLVSASSGGFAAEMLAERILTPGNTVSEEEFIREVEEMFVELQFFGETPSEVGDRARTIGSVLAVYWVVGNHYKLFVREQHMDACMTKSTWSELQDWTRNIVQLTKSSAIVGAMIVFLSVMNLGRMNRFRKVFAPEYDDPQDAMSYILQNSPILVPSFMKLPRDLQTRILLSLKADFNFGQFLQAENLPVNLYLVKNQLFKPEEDASLKSPSVTSESDASALQFFLFMSFAKMCALRSAQSLRGSLMMTEQFFSNFKLGLDAVIHLNAETPREVLDRFLAERAKLAGVDFNPKDLGERALVRLICMNGIYDADGAQTIVKSWHELEAEVKAALTTFLNADGIQVKPAFLMYFAPRLLEYSKKNLALGPTLGMRMLLNVYQEASKEYHNSEQDFVTIMVDDLSERARQTIDPEAFEFTKFEIVRSAGDKGDTVATVRLSPWTIDLANNANQLENFRSDCVEFSCQILLNGGLKENVFWTKAKAKYPELQYLSSNVVAYQQARVSLQSVHWIVAGQFEAFTRGHNSDDRLSDTSWNKIQDMLASAFDDEAEGVDAMLVAAAIQHLGKVELFAQQLAPGVHGHRKVLAHVMETCPKVLPSYYRLDPVYKQLVRECLTTEFDFERFLRGETLWTSLRHARTMLHKKIGSMSSKEIFGFYSFLCFIALSGSLGAESSEGSIYMTEARFLDCSNGVAILKEMSQQGQTIPDAFATFLQSQAASVGLPFESYDSAQSKAATRLVSLAGVTDSAKAKEIVDAFLALSPEENTTLTNHLNANEEKSSPDFVLADASAFFTNACRNRCCGLLSALRLLTILFDKFVKEMGCTKLDVELQLWELARQAKNWSEPDSFHDCQCLFHKQPLSEATYDVLVKEAENLHPECLQIPSPSAPRTGNEAPRRGIVLPNKEPGKMPQKFKANVERSSTVVRLCTRSAESLAEEKAES